MDPRPGRIVWEHNTSHLRRPPYRMPMTGPSTSAASSAKRTPQMMWCMVGLVRLPRGQRDCGPRLEAPTEPMRAAGAD